MRKHAYLPSFMTRYELTYYNGRDIDRLGQQLRIDNNRYTHYYAYVGQFVQSRADPFYACCDVSLAAVIESKLRILHLPKPNDTRGMSESAEQTDTDIVDGSLWRPMDVVPSELGEE